MVFSKLKFPEFSWIHFDRWHAELFEVLSDLKVPVINMFSCKPAHLIRANQI